MSLLTDILLQYTGSSYSDLTSALKSRINIVLKVDNTTDSIVFPVVPGDFPDMNSPQDNDTFEAVTGDINVIGAPKLRTLSFSSWICSALSTISYTIRKRTMISNSRLISVSTRSRR